MRTRPFDGRRLASLVDWSPERRRVDAVSGHVGCSTGVDVAVWMGITRTTVHSTAGEPIGHRRPRCSSPSRSERRGADVGDAATGPGSGRLADTFRAADDGLVAARTG